MMGNISNDQSVVSKSLPDSRQAQALQKTKIEINIYVELFEVGGGRSTIIFTEDTTGLKHVFNSVKSGDTLTDTSFLAYSGEDDAILKTTNSLHDCLLRDPFFETKYDLEIVAGEKATSTFPFDSYTLVITSKEIGRQYDCSVDTNVVDPYYIAYKTVVQKSIGGNLYEIVNVDKPKEITLANNPNFVTFSNVNEGQRTQPARMSIVIIDNGHLDIAPPQDKPKNN